MNDDLLLIQLRDCFTAGYTLPQFCIDNNIKKPLIVGVNESQAAFLWELHVQFQFDVRVNAVFALMNCKSELNFTCLPIIVSPLHLLNISELNLADYDKIIVMQSEGIQGENVICLKALLEYCKKRTYVEVPLLKFVAQNPGVKVIQVNIPDLKYQKNLSENERKLLSENRHINYLLDELKQAQKQGKTISTPYDFLGYSNQKVFKLLSVPGLKRNPDGSDLLNDDEEIGIKDGKRITVDQPKNYKNKICFVGNCVYYGYGVPFDKTLESQLQKLLNKYDLPYKVENAAQFICDRQQSVFYTLNTLKLKSGDIVFVYLDIFLDGCKCIPFLDIRRALDRPHNYGETFPDGAGHINELGHKAIAEKLFEFLTKNNFFKDVEFNYPNPPPSVHRYGIPTENSVSPTTFLQNKELEEYKKKLREKRFSVGAIVMNCNPFTLGHEYLVEYASKKVKKLFIFVVEEDKSEFKFADRFKLVQAGVKKFSNVEVLPSGKFIISQKTFSGYFNKENLHDVSVDSSEDVEIFAREIAPSLGITIRFVGEEPEDSVTRQYNENMKRILPQYNVDVCEIPRRETGGEVISAKKVREALKVGDFDKIKKLVPKTTLKFLRENF